MPRATWVVAGVAALLVTGGLGSVWIGDYGGDYPLSNPWWWLEWTGSVIPMVWLVVYPPAAYRRWIDRAAIRHARAA